MAVERTMAGVGASNGTQEGGERDNGRVERRGAEQCGTGREMDGLGRRPGWSRAPGRLQAGFVLGHMHGAWGRVSVR